MISYLAKQNIDVYIRVHSFNITLDVIIENERVTPENMEELIQKINELQPECSTNIELALNDAKETLHHYAESNPEHQIAHVFMTDGDPTIGQTCKFELAKLVDEQFANIFVGFGLEHNGLLLKKLSEKRMRNINSLMIWRTLALFMVKLFIVSYIQLYLQSKFA